MMLKSCAVRRFVLALGIASMVATVHGAWFTAPDVDATSSAAVARVRFSVWDNAQRMWTSKYLTNGEVIQGAEGDIIELKPEIAGTSVSSIPSYLVAISLATPPQSACERLDVSCTIPVPAPTDAALAADGTPFYGRLALSQTVYAVGAPNAGQSAPEVGTPDVNDLSATDQSGSVGVNAVTLNVGADAISFTWDVSRWAKGDVFVGLNYAAYKVLDRHGNFKRYLASSDYGRLDKYGGPIGEATTGCAANWRTGEIFMTNFDDVDPAINVVTRQPGSGTNYPFPYADRTRRLSTAIFRSQEPTDGTYVSPIDTSPESVVFDSSENLYVGHSGPYFATRTGSILDPNLKTVVSSSSYSFVDEIGDQILARPMGSSDSEAPIYYGAMSSRLDTDETGEPQFNPQTLFTWGTGGGESAMLTLPKAIWEDAAANLALESVAAPGTPLAARPILGKRLHKYNYTGVPAAPYSGAGAARELHWTFTNLQGTDWVDLAVDQRTIFYTSENSYIHRYDTVTGRQLADFGTGQRRQLGGPMRTFHALRILPPGDGTGGVIVAAGTEILRLNADGQIIQRYQAVGDPDVDTWAGYSSGGLVQGWYSLQVHPSGRTFWASGHDTGYLYQFDLATGAQLRRVKAVDFLPLNHESAPFGRRVEGICIMWEYTAAQEVCGDGIDNDGDGFIDESCTPIESCSITSPGDDDRDGLADHNDPDCGEERPPVAVDDLYGTDQDVPKAIPANGVLSNDADPDNADGDPLNDDPLTVGTVGTDVGTLSVSSVGLGIPTAHGGTVALAGNGSFTYTPASGFHGIDTFVYQAFDGAGLSNAVTVTIRVRPRVADDSYTMLQQGTLSVHGLDVSPAGMLVNDSTQPMLVAAVGAGPGVTPFSVSAAVTTANGGQVVIFESGNFVYQPPVTFVGVDSFVYRGKDLASDSSNLATVTITVEDVNELSATNDAVSTPHGTPVTVNVRANDVDPEGHTFRVTTVNGQTIATGQTVPVVNGTVTLNAAGNLVVTPATGFFGLLNFIYTIEDSPASPMLPLTATARVDVTVGAPSISGTQDSYTTPQNTLLIVDIPGVLANDVGVGPLQVYSAGVSPALSVLNPWATFLTAEGGQVTIRPDGGFTFAPRLNFVGVDRFNYTLINPEGTPSSVVAVSLTVTPTSSAAVVTSPNPSVYGTVAPVTATIRCGALLTPSVGTVTFRQDTTILASGVAVVNGIATTTLPASLAVGNHPVTVEYSGVVDVCPTAAGSTTHRVTPAVLTVRAGNQSRVYGSANAALISSITGFVAGDDISVVTGAAALNTAATSASGVGTYAITAAQGTLAAANYTFMFVDGDLTVTPAVLTVTADNKSKVYGAVNPALTSTITGFVNGDPATVVTGTAALNTAATSASGVGTYAIAAAPGTLAATNYTFVFANGTLTVSPAVLTVTADDKSKVYGATNPALTSTITGFVNGDLATVVTGTAALSTTAITTSPVGTYPITAAPGTLQATNYTFTYVPGTLTVTRGTATVAVPNVTAEYDGTPKPTTCTVTSAIGTSLPGALSYVGAGATGYGPSAVAPTAVGTYEATCTFAGDANHAGPVAATGRVTITPKAATVIAFSGTKIAGTADPILLTTSSGFVTTDLATITLTTTRALGETVGGYITTATAIGPALGNYVVTYVAGIFTITNRPPVAVGDVAGAIATVPVLIPVLTNDSDPDGHTITVVGFTQPAGGTVTESGGVFTFVANVGFFGSTSFTYTITDGWGGTSTATVVVTVSSAGGSYRTQTQGGWGSTPSGGNPGAFLAANFTRVFASGYVQVGGGKTLRFMSAAAVEAFLPQGGKAAKLAASAENPTSSAAGVFAGQVLALQISVSFSNAGITKSGLGALKVQSGKLAGKTVAEVLAMANSVLGGGALPSGLSISDLNSIVDAINNNFVDGTTDKGYLR